MKVGKNRMNMKLIQPLIPAMMILVIGIFQPWGLTGDLIFFILSVICLGIGFFYMKRMVNEHTNINKARVVQQLMRHQRHDWLNHVQVIMGYQMMNQSEKMANYLQKMIHTAKDERKITDFAYPPLAAMLLTVQYDYPKWDWQLVLEDDFSFQNIEQEQQLFHLLQIFLPWFVEQAKHEQNWVQIQLRLSQHDQQFILHFTCMTENGEKVERTFDLQEITHKLDRWSAVCNWSHTEQQLTIKVPN